MDLAWGLRCEDGYCVSDMRVKECGLENFIGHELEVVGRDPLYGVSYLRVSDAYKYHVFKSLVMKAAQNNK